MVRGGARSGAWGGRELSEAEELEAGRGGVGGGMGMVKGLVGVVGSWGQRPEGACGRFSQVFCVGWLKAGKNRGRSPVRGHSDPDKGQRWRAGGELLRKRIGS